MITATENADPMANPKIMGRNTVAQKQKVLAKDLKFLKYKHRT